jgi:lysozyme
VTPFALTLAIAGCSAGPGSASGECTGEASAALRKCAAGKTVRGVDVSYYQGNVSWAKVRKSGRRFAFARVSDGVGYPDSKFQRNWGAMKRAGLVRGAYQFFRPGQSATAQAKLLVRKLRAAGGLKAGDLPPVLDIEVTDGHSSSLVVSRARTWLSYVTKKTGRRPIVYTAAFMSGVLGKHLSAYPLWVANFGASCPTMPSGWSTWRFFQSSDRGSVSGIGGRVDTDLFNGTLAHMKATAVLTKAAKIDGEPPEGALPEDAAEAADGALPEAALEVGPEVEAPGAAEAPDAPDAPDDADLAEDDGVVPSESVPEDGSEGFTMGSQSLTDEAPLGDAAPCSAD